MRKSFEMWWPGTELNRSACFAISKLLIPRSAQSAHSAQIANPVCVLCAVASVPICRPIPVVTGCRCRFQEAPLILQRYRDLKFDKIDPVSAPARWVMRAIPPPHSTQASTTKHNKLLESLSRHWSRFAPFWLLFTDKRRTVTAFRDARTGRSFVELFGVTRLINSLNPCGSSTQGNRLKCSNIPYSCCEASKSG